MTTSSATSADRLTSCPAARLPGCPAARLPAWSRPDETATVVKLRFGMKSHGQAQLANELLTAQALDRYSITAIGYGPGSVNTSVRGEIPGWIQTVMTPFFARSTRQPDEVARQLFDLLLDPDVETGHSYFANFGRDSADDGPRIQAMR